MKNSWQQQQQQQQQNLRDRQMGYAWQQQQQQQSQERGCVSRVGQVGSWIVFIGICLLIVIFLLNFQGP
jgi:hypothetical protein